MMPLVFNNLDILYSPSPILYKKIANQELWEITSEIKCSIHIPQLNPFTYCYNIDVGFKTNFRSGPEIILDLIIDRIGESDLALCWLIHDINYEGFISQSLADCILYYMLRDLNDIKKINAQFIYIGLRLFGVFNYSTENKPNNFVEFESKLIEYGRANLETAEENSVYNKDANKSIIEEKKPIINLKFDKSNKAELSKELKNLANKHNRDFNEKEFDSYFE